jgi:ElaB/YqjD/DUF883 family membrane-anchored ribosome-binding protein
MRSSKPDDAAGAPRRFDAGMRITAAALLAASLLVVAGCGSSSSGTTTSAEAAATAWAGGVCLTFTQYKQDLKQAADNFRSNPSKNQLYDSVNAIETASRNARDQLHGIGPPPAETQQGRQAIDTFRNEIQAELDEIDSIMKGVSNAQEARAAAPKIRAEAQKMQTSLHKAVATLQTLPGGALQTGFKNAPNCQALVT